MEKVKNFPNEILSLYIAEVLIMETHVKNVTKYSKIDSPILKSLKEIPDKKKDLSKYNCPLHEHVQCMCDGCKIWDFETRKWCKENPLEKYNLHLSGIHVLQNNSKYYYSNKYIYPEQENSLENLPFIDINNISLEKCQNDIERKMVGLLLREKDPVFIEKHYTDWFKFLIKDRLPFTDDTIIVYNVVNIILKYGGKVISSLKSYKGNFTFFHVRLMRKKILSKTRNGKQVFHLSGGNSTELEAKIKFGNLIINIC